MPDIKLRDGSGVEQTYTGVDTITVPLADGSGNFTYGPMINLNTNTWERVFADTSVLYTERLMKDNYIIKLINKDNLISISYAFQNNEFVTDLSEFKITAKSMSGCFYVFAGCVNLKKIFDITPFAEKGSSLNSFGSLVKSCYSLEQEEIQKLLNSIYSYQKSSQPQGPLIGDNYMLKEIDLSKNESMLSGGNISWGQGVNSQPTLQKITSFKVATKGAASSQIWDNNYWSKMYMLSSFVFPMEGNGNPFKAMLRNQNIDFSKEKGYKDFYEVGQAEEVYKYGYVNKQHNIYFGEPNEQKTFTVEGIKAKYNDVKQFNDWHSCGSSYFKVTYNDKQYNPSILTARYNHDSAVETLNSLPDTSEYLATAGGTNTIKFKGVQGALTDGGAINTLTEEEIAVATAKGWTVTFV